MIISHDSVKLIFTPYLHPASVHNPCSFTAECELCGPSSVSVVGGTLRIALRHKLHTVNSYVRFHVLITEAVYFAMHWAIKLLDVNPM